MQTSMGDIPQSLSVGGIVSNPLALCMCVWGWDEVGERQRDREGRNRWCTMSINKIQLLSFNVRFKVLSFLPILQYLLVFYGFLVVILAWWPYLPLSLMLESISTRHFWNWLVCFRIILAVFFFLVCTTLKFMKLICSDPNKSRNKTLLIL